MKKKLRIILGIILLVLLGVVTLGVAEKNGFLGIDRWGNEEYYVQIKDNGEKTSDGLFPYYYKEKAYSKNGDEIEVEFYADKNLTINAYLSVDTQTQSKKKTNSIESYKEVEANEIPDKAKVNLEKNK